MLGDEIIARRLQPRTFPSVFPAELRGEALNRIDDYAGIPDAPFEIICSADAGGTQYYDLEISDGKDICACHLRIPNSQILLIRDGFFAEKYRRCTRYREATARKIPMALYKPEEPKVEPEEPKFTSEEPNKKDVA